jgi:MOSC domain-containing protein YiiM
MACVISLNVGKPATLVCPDRTVMSGIRKAPVARPVRLTAEGLEGDGQADHVAHGGPDKAMCAYPTEHLPYWSARLGRALAPAAFGENLSTEGLLERELHIGGVFRLGGTVVQVSQPRGPCFKLAALNGEPHLAQWVQSAGLTGFYFRCLEPGMLRSGDEFVLIDANERAPTIADAVRVQYTDRDDRATIERLATCDALADAWRSVFAKRLVGLQN